MSGTDGEPVAAADAEEPVEPPAKKKRGAKGLPKGVIEHNTKKFQARLTYEFGGQKINQRPIPGLFATVDQAVAVQAEALAKIEADGPLAVWQTAVPPPRNSRGQVHLTQHPCR